MMHRIRKGITHFILGSILSFLLLLPFLPIWEKVPYTNVELISVENVGGEVIIDTVFYKTECRFVQLVVVGSTLGFAQNYKWDNIDGIVGDRVEGQQRLSLVVYLDGSTPKTLEVRTRHLCDTKIVDKVFIEVEVPYAKEDLG